MAFHGVLAKINKAGAYAPQKTPETCTGEGTLNIAALWPNEKSSKPSKHFASAYEQYQKIALDEARRVPWPQLMQFVEESLRWEVFNFWIRAVVNAAKGIPPVIEPELESRIPGFLARVLGGAGIGG